jgi:hypothetical protein
MLYAYDYSDSYEYFFKKMREYLNISDIDGLIALCKEKIKVDINNETEKYGHIFLSTALLNLLPDEKEKLFLHKDFITMLAEKIHHSSHLIQMYHEIPHQYLFDFFSKINRSLFFRLSDSDASLIEGINSEHLELWLLSMRIEIKNKDLPLNPLEHPLDFITSLDKETLLEFIKKGPNKLLLLVKLMPTYEQKQTLLDYLNASFNTIEDRMSICNKNRPRKWYTDANFVMTILLRKDGFKAYYQGKKKATQEEEQLLDSYIIKDKLVIDNGDALALHLDVTLAHRQKALIVSLERIKIAGLFKSAFQLNAVLESLHFNGTKRYFLEILNNSAPNDEWISKLYTVGKTAQHAFKQLSAKSEDLEIIKPYMKTANESNKPSRGLMSFRYLKSDQDKRMVNTMELTRTLRP